MTTLIVSDPWDIHARAVAWALEHEGENVHLWYTHDFPQKHGASLRVDSAGASADPAQVTLHCARHHRDFGSHDIDTVWLRRWYQPQASPDLHPADTRFAQTEANEFIRATIGLLDESPRFWINPVAAKARADRKAAQLKVAAAVGLTVPSTLISNDPATIRAFFHEHGGKLIYKPMTGASWVSEDKALATYTAAIGEELLGNDASLSNAPGIYQPLLDKSYELRVTVMGRTVVAAQIKSQNSGGYLVDWRANDFDEAMGYARYALPEAIEQRCLALMERMGLVFGCIDFVVTTQGEYMFLEVNEMGQFLWLEGVNPELQLLDCFVQFSQSRDPNFVYDWRRPVYRYREYWESMEQRGDVDPPAHLHLALPRTFEMRE
ncbi:hypothetical protein [Lysobacter capsici]|uniref:hypothetical protein n=1 Tax=Lysobacter capsici TaxID=435897 RepID=UPI000BBAA528|nr:hypothetical protein [Lysobacter capsici]ATE71197.1 hypothetical protein CNO08_07400 [Lysobacter capsici]